MSVATAGGHDAVTPIDSIKARVLSGDLVATRQACQVLIEDCPEQVEAIHLLAVAVGCAGETGEALRLLRRALALDGTKAGWWRDLGMLYSVLQDWDAAADAFYRGNRLEPEEFRTAGAHADALIHLKRFDEAQGILSAAVRCGYQILPACERLAEVWKRSWQFDKERKIRKWIADLQPDTGAAWAALAASQWACGQLSECLSSFDIAVTLLPDVPELHSEFLTYLLHDPNQNAYSLRQAHENWARAHCSRMLGPIYESDYNPERRLKIGYLTGEFQITPAFHFLFPILRNHDDAQFDIYAYYSAALCDGYTREYEKVVPHWRTVAGMSVEEVRARVAEDGIDVLVDLSGHYPANRLDVFATRAAPVQVTLPNYPATTGVAGIDYIITDWWTCPAGDESQYTETAVRLSTWYMPYRPPAVAPEPTPLPANSNGVVTFGLFQRPSKMNEGVWDAVAAVLRQTSDSRLLIHCAWRNLDDRSDPLCRRLENELVRRGISAERIFFRGSLDLSDHLALMCNVDIALDTFPYNGQTTTCECLWTGIPVVTVAGASHVSRVGCALLHYAGLDDWVARNVEEYVQIATQAASDIPSLARLRNTLRRRIGASVLVDSAEVTHEIEAAYRSMWRECCARRRVTLEGRTA